MPAVLPTAHDQTHSKDLPLIDDEVVRPGVLSGVERICL
jgi:hypothetical protein